MAKNEREILREWTTIVSAIDEGMFGPKPGEKEYRPMDLGGGSGQFGGGSRVGGAGGKIEPTLSVPSGPKPRYRKEGEKWVEVPQTKVKTTEPTSSGKIEPRLDEPAPSSTAAAKDPNAINFKRDAYNAAKAVVGDTYKGVKNIGRSKAVTAVGGLGAAGYLASKLLGTQTEPGETKTDALGRIAGDIGTALGKGVSKAVIGGGSAVSDEIDKAAEKRGYNQDSSVFKDKVEKFDRDVDDYKLPPLGTDPGSAGSAANREIKETRIFTQHPVSGKIVQLNVDNISRVVNQTFYESYECGAGDSAQWQCQIWSSTPVSKLLKGRS